MNSSGIRNAKPYTRYCTLWNGLVLDSNVFVTYLVGKYGGEKALNSHNRAKYSGYMHGDYDALNWIIGIAYKIVTTRYVMAQVSDLYPLENKSKTTNNSSDAIIDNISAIINEDCNGIEVLSRRKATKQFGFADSSIIEISDKNYAILTIDGPLLGYLKMMSACVIGMDRLRVLFAKEKHSLKSFI